MHSPKTRSCAALQGDADIDKAEDEPLRHAAVKSAGGEKGNGEQGQQKHGDGRGPQMDVFFFGC